MVVTRSGAGSSFLSLDNVINETVHLEDSLERVVTDLSIELRRFKANYPSTDLDKFESSVAQLVVSLDEAAAVRRSAETSENDLKLQVTHLEHLLQNSKTLRTNELNKSLSAQDCLIEENDAIKNEKSVLMSCMNMNKSKLKVLEECNVELQNDIFNKDSVISDLTNKLQQYQKQNLDLISNQKRLETLVQKTKERAWLPERWVDDNILDSYFETFGRSVSNLKSRTIFIGPSVTQLIRFGDQSDVLKQLNEVSFMNSNFSFFCINNSISFSKADAGSHWSLLFLDHASKKAFHFDSLVKRNHCFALDVLKKLNFTSNLIDVDCCKQNNSYECGINVLMYAKLVSGAFCSSASLTGSSFMEWYNSVVLGLIPSHCNDYLTKSSTPFSRSLPSPPVPAQPSPPTPYSSPSPTHNLQSMKICSSGWNVVKGNGSRVASQIVNDTVKLTNLFSVLSDCSDDELCSNDSFTGSVSGSSAFSCSSIRKLKSRHVRDSVSKISTPLTHSLPSPTIAAQPSPPTSSSSPPPNFKSCLEVTPQSSSTKCLKISCLPPVVADKSPCPPSMSSCPVKSSFVHEVLDDGTTHNLSRPTEPKALLPKYRLFADSHGRHLGSLVNNCFSDKSDFHAFVRPGAKMCNVVNKVQESVKELSSQDYVLVLAGTNDVDSGCCGDSYFQSLLDLAHSTINTNLIVIGVPYRKDKPNLNKLISDTNRRMIRILNRFKHSQFLSLSSVFKSKLYIKPGLHFNLSGKRIIAKLIYSLLEHSTIGSKSPVLCKPSAIPVIVSQRTQPAPVPRKTKPSYSPSLTPCTTLVKSPCNLNNQIVNRSLGEDCVADLSDLERHSNIISSQTIVKPGFLEVSRDLQNKI